MATKTWDSNHLLKEVGSLHVHTHGSEHNGKLVTASSFMCSMASLWGFTTLAAIHQTCLSANLCCNIVVWKTCRYV
jgi:hypothetical protein